MMTPIQTAPPCQSCLVMRERTRELGIRKLPRLRTATGTLQVHDGRCEYTAHLCSDHERITLALAIARYGHQDGDRVIAWPQRVH